MDDSKLSIEQLSALSRAVPEDSERKDLALFLQVTALATLSDCLLSRFQPSSPAYRGGEHMANLPREYKYTSNYDFNPSLARHVCFEACALALSMQMDQPQLPKPNLARHGVPYLT